MTAGTAALAEVTDGTVGVARAADAIDVAAGFGTVARQDAPLAPPRALLPAPGVDAGPVQQRLPARCAGAAVPGAARYRAELRGTAAPAIR